MAEHDRKIDDEQARDLYDAGQSDSQIAEVFGVKKQAVCRWRKRNDLEANRPRILPAYQRPKPTTLADLMARSAAASNRAVARYTA